MSAAETGSGSAAALAREFDAAFAALPAEPIEMTALLSIRVGNEALALRVSEVASLHLAGKIVPLPTAAPGLLGVVGIRGRVVPVYDLATVLGREPGASLRWVVLTGIPTVALAFEVFDRQARIPTASVVTTGQDERFVRAVATIDGAARPILDIASLHAEIARLARATRAVEEEREPHA